MIGTGGTTTQSGEAYNGTSGSDTGFVDKVKYDFSGEFGFTFLLGEKVAMRIGVEGVQSKSITALGNSYGSGTNYLSVVSGSTVFNPNLTFESAFANSGTSRYFGFIGGGYASAKVNNSYTMTAAGQTQYASTPATFGDEWQGTAISADAGLGAEYFIFDNVTISLVGGYRYMNFSTLTYVKAGSAFHNGTYQTVTAGENVTDTFGKAVHVDMSGYFGGMMLRFFIPPLN